MATTAKAARAKLIADNIPGGNATGWMILLQKRAESRFQLR